MVASQIEDYGERKIRLVASDIEGCFTQKERGKLNLAGLSEVQSFCACDSQKIPPVIIVTGRSAPYVESVVQMIGALGPKFCIPSVIENGALFYDHNTRSICGTNPSIPKDWKARTRLPVDELKKEYSGKIIEEPGKEICISLNPKGMTIPELYNLVVSKLESTGLKPTVDVTYCSSSVDIIPKGVSKWSGLKYILEKYNIPSEYVLGIGDTFADVVWLKELGFTACPLNGTEDVQKVRGIYVSDYEDSKGVGQILQHFILRYL